MKRIRSLAISPATLFVVALSPATLFAGPVGVVPFVEIGTEYDSNVFRFTDEEQAREVTGSDERSDTITRGRLGAAVEWPVSRQRFSAAASVSENRYDRFDQLDHSENEIRAQLEFQAGSAVYGTAKVLRARRLDNFDDLDNTEPSFVEETFPEVETFVAVTPSWRVRTRVGHLRLDREFSQGQDVFDLRETRYEAELQYEGGPGSVVGAGVEYIDGEYPNRDSGGVLSDEFEQQTAFVSANWRYSGISTFRGRLGYTQRDNSGGVGDRNFEGLTGRFTYDRVLSGKTRLQLQLFREIFSVDDVDANFVQSTGALAELFWEYSPKLGMTAGLRHTERDFQVLEGFSQARIDDVNSFTTELIYAPISLLSFIFSLTAESRDSTEEDESFDALVAGLTLRLSLDTD